MTKKKIFIGFIITILSFIVISLIYLCTGNYSANKEVLKYLNTTEKVNVKKINDGYFFDGPGTDTAVIFYPGAKVEYTAYSKLIYKIAENGYDSFLIEMPFNIAFFGVNKADNIITKYDYKNWYISGHSLGGVIACAYATDHPKNIKGVISLAAYPSKKLPKDIEYISIYGSEDKVLNKEKYSKSKQYFPKNNKEYIIDGGNHAGFANYGKQKGDGKATITNSEQQKSVIDILFKNEN